MSRVRLAILATAVSSTVASISWGQGYQLEVEAIEFNVTSSTELPEVIEFTPIGSFERTEIEFAGHDAAYGDNYWGETKLGRKKINLDGPLVNYYEVQDIQAMKQRVAEADVVDESASFPVPRSSVRPVYGRCFLIARPTPRKSTAGLVVKTVEQPIGRSRYDEKPSINNVDQEFIVVNYADSELLGMSP